MRTISELARAHFPSVPLGLVRCVRPTIASANVNVTSVKHQAPGTEAKYLGILQCTFGGFCHVGDNVIVSFNRMRKLTCTPWPAFSAGRVTMAGSPSPTPEGPR